MKWFLFCLSVQGMISLGAQASPFKVPALTGPVIDEAGILSSSELRHLEQKAFRLRDENKAQLQIYIASSLQGLPIEQASIEIVDQWKLGGKDTDNGLLFLIVPSEKRMRLEVGQGLEGTIPDVYAKRILDDVVAPFFRQGQWASGIIEGEAAIEGLLRGGEPPAPRRKKLQISPIFFLILLIMMTVLGRLRPRSLRGGGPWIGGGGLGGGWGGGSGGGWSGGGGGFSGGGSSSSW